MSIETWLAFCLTEAVLCLTPGSAVLLLVPQLISPEARVAPQVLALGVSSVLIEFLALALFIALSGRARGWVGAGFASVLERIGGGLLVAAGTRLGAVRS